LGGQGIEMIDILMVCVPATIIGVLVGALAVNFIGVDLEKDPIYLKRLQEGLIQTKEHKASVAENSSTRPLIAVILFLVGVFSVVIFGSFSDLRPSFLIDGEMVKITMPQIIEIVMMSAAGLILVFAKADVTKAVNGSIFIAGMQAVIAIFGIAWLGDTFFNGNLAFFKDNIQSIVTTYPFLFAFALFVMSILLFSQAATVRTLYPLGLALGIPPLALLAMFPAVNGYF